jgi:hypothetical protein
MPDSTTVVHGTVNAGVVGSNPTRAVLTIPEAVFVAGACSSFLVLFGLLVVLVSAGCLILRFVRAVDMPPLTFINDHGIPHTLWSSDHRVRRLQMEEARVKEMRGKRISRIVALLLATWFCGVVFWYAAQFMAERENWASGLLFATYAAKLVGAIAAFFGALFLFGFLVSRGRLFLNDFDE